MYPKSLVLRMLKHVKNIFLGSKKYFFGFSCKTNGVKRSVKMIQIQPCGISFSSHKKPSFKGREDANDMFSDENIEEVKRNKKDFEELKSKKDTPKFIKGIATVGVAGGSALIAAASMKYGLEYSMDLFSKFNKSKMMEPIISGIKSGNEFIGKQADALKENLLKSDFYTKNAEKFKNTKFGSTVCSKYQKMTDSDGYKKFIADYKELKSNIKPKTKKLFVDTAVGASAFCAGVESTGIVKEKQQEKTDRIAEENEFNEGDE